LKRAGAILFVVLSGCRAHGESAEAVRAEAGQVARAVRTLRDAPNEAKAPLLDALSATPCSANDVCAARDACAAAYGIQVQALENLHAVRRAATGSTDPVPSAAVDVLARAESDLRRAADQEKACADLEAALTKKYGL
jgi:hypothetical protein